MFVYCRLLLYFFFELNLILKFAFYVSFSYTVLNTFSSYFNSVIHQTRATVETNAYVLVFLCSGTLWSAMAFTPGAAFNRTGHVNVSEYK